MVGDVVPAEPGLETRAVDLRTAGRPAGDVPAGNQPELTLGDESSAIRIYLSTEVTDRQLGTLMHDSQCRAEVARQQTTYNQPSYDPGFYLGPDVDWSEVPLPRR